MADLLHKPILDPSSTTLLVTGASGFIASHVIDQALKLGYSVRGTARTQAKADQTVKVHNSPKYEAVVVPDFGKPSTEIDNAVKGVTSICHVASDTTFDEDPEKVVTPVVNGILAVLAAAAKEPSVKRFTLTSSSTAALTPKPGVKQVATTKSWNDEAVDYAWNKKGQSIGANSYAFLVYAASKTEGEKAFWKFVEEKKPSFVANTVLPNFNSGATLKGGSSGITAKMIQNLYQEGARLPLPPQYYIDVVDNARLHLIPALLDGDIKNERLFAFAEPMSTNQVIDIIQKIKPDWKVKVEKDPDEGEDVSVVPNDITAQLLKKWYGQDGFVSLEQSLKENLKDL